MRDKQEYRNALKEKRNAIPPEQRKEWDVAIIKRIAASDVFKNAHEILIYAPIGSEINLLPLARAAQMQGKRIAFPRCDIKTTTLQFYYLEGAARLEVGAYRIPEPPANAPLCIPTKHSLCIVPALSFDLSGARLGYGRGYYDRFLSSYRGLAVGIARDAFILPKLPRGAFDLRVKVLASETEVKVLS